MHAYRSGSTVSFPSADATLAGLTSIVNRKYLSVLSITRSAFRPRACWLRHPRSLRSESRGTSGPCPRVLRPSLGTSSSAGGTSSIGRCSEKPTLSPFCCRLLPGSRPLCCSHHPRVFSPWTGAGSGWCWSPAATSGGGTATHRGTFCGRKPFGEIWGVPPARRRLRCCIRLRLAVSNRRLWGEDPSIGCRAETHPIARTDRIASSDVSPSDRTAADLRSRSSCECHRLAGCC